MRPPTFTVNSREKLYYRTITDLYIWNSAGKSNLKVILSIQAL
jgi:hypothetical protein